MTGANANMATSAQIGAEQPPIDGLSSNNPYREQMNRGSAADEELAKEQLQSLDSDKQVVSSEVQSGPSNAPMVVDKEASPDPQPEPVWEAGKEVVNSWQSKSREESAPTSMDYHESLPPQGDLLNDVKGPPPDYDSLNRQSRSASDDLITTPTAIEPDDSGVNLPPRPEDRTAVGQLLSWIPPAPRIPMNKMSALLQPVVIPQLDVPPQGESVPFARCYSDALASHDVSMRDFTSFLDGLALAQAPNSALQSLKMLGAGVSFVPLPFIPWAGKGISALASSGSGHSGSRARLYLDRAKKEYFAPRGLRLSVIKDNDLNPRLQIPAHAYRLAPLTNNTLTENLARRRLEGVAPYVAPLRFDVPEQDKQIQGVHKLARKHLEHRFKDEAKRLTKLREEQWRDISHAGIETRGWDERYAAKMGKLRSLQSDIIREQRPSEAGEKPSGLLREMMEALEQSQRELQIMVTERQTSMQNALGGSKGVEAEMKEVNWGRRLKWIVIENMQ